MSHHDAQHYAAKHTPDTALNPEIAAEIEQTLSQSATQGKITCAQAHQIASKLGVSPVEVGKTLDLLEIRISQCQLGLFANRETSDSQIRLEDLPPALVASLEPLTAAGKALSCREAWKIAEQQTILKTLVSAACDVLQIKIVECQLGTF